MTRAHYICAIVMDSCDLDLPKNDKLFLWKSSLLNAVVVLLNLV